MGEENNKEKDNNKDYYESHELSIKETVIEEEVKKSYIDYAMSVIVSRALPDVRDGLKPVHRRILYTMHELGLQHNKPFKKSARIVGETLGKYHPHGDTAVYDALVRMAQSFSLRYPLVIGQGNFGSIDGDSAAAMRYTEAKLSEIAEEMLVDIDKDVVDFMPNFDNTLKEPVVLPSRIPNLLINGTTGIAVGMATNIPPHNIVEVCDALIATIRNPDITINEIMDIIKGPDFPTGAIIYKNGLLEAYKTGSGKIIVSAKINHEFDEKKKRHLIVITEIPYMLNKSLLVENIADLVKQGRLEEVADLRDESDRHGIRIVVELRKGADPKICEKKLLRYTRLEDTFRISFLALINNEPKQLNIKQILLSYIEHRKQVIIRRTKFLLKKAQERKHIVDGLLKAIDHIEDVITIIKLSNTVNYAKKRLMEKYGFSEKQVTAIMDMRLQKLASLETKKLEYERQDLIKNIGQFENILSHEEVVYDMIIKDLEDIKLKYGDERRTEIKEVSHEFFDEEELIKDEPCVIILSERNYIKRLSMDEYRTQSRGGKGIISASLGDQDYIKDIIITSTKRYLLIFTSYGKVYWLKVYKVPEHSRYSHGNAIVNYLNLHKDERITAVISIKDFSKGYLFMATKKGIVKKIKNSEFSLPKKSGGKIIINLKSGDELIDVIVTSGDDDIILASRDGYCIRFSESDVKAVGRTAKGVIGMRLTNDDYVVSLSKITKEDLTQNKTLLSVTTRGYGKRTFINNYPRIRRGGKGVINIKLKPKDKLGDVVGSYVIGDSDELMLITKKGKTIKIRASDISIYGRITSGIRLIKLEEDDEVSDVAIIHSSKLD